MESMHIKYIVNRVVCLSYHQGIFHVRYCIKLLETIKLNFPLYSF